MEQISLLEWLKKEQVLKNEWYDCLRYELDKHIYYYGNHFKRSLENVQTDKKEKAKYELKRFAAKTKGRFSKKQFDRSKQIIISNAYFNFNEELSATGTHVIQPPWVINLDSWKYYDADLITLCAQIKKLFAFAPFSYLVSKEFISVLEDFSNRFKSFILKEKISALVIPNDESFFENISIKIFKELGLPTFLFLHGLPARYNLVDEHRSDYLIVWGKKLKELYIRNGIAENKIFISGHPSYNNFDTRELKFSFENILILTKTIAGSPHSDGAILSDRGTLIVYLLAIQKVLQKLGVKQVRLRPHPSENIEWYMKFLDKDFFIPDTKNLTDSLGQTSLLIGPVSSVFLEALFFKVNYLVYEPMFNGKGILNYPIAPPFDGTDERIPVAYDEDNLLKFLCERRCVNVDLLPDYIQTPFDISFIKLLLEK